VTDLSGTKVSARHCGQCVSGDLLPSLGLVRLGSGDLYLFDQTSIKRIAAAPVDVDDCAAVAVGVSGLTDVRAMTAAGAELLVADGGRLRGLSGLTGAVSLTTIAGAPPALPTSDVPAVHAKITAFTVDRASGTSWLAEQRVVEAVPHCSLRSLSPLGVMTTHIDAPCGTNDSVFGVGGRLSFVTSMEVDSAGVVHFIDASGGMNEITVLRTFSPNDGRLQTNLSVNDLFSVAIDADDTRHLLTRTGYFTLVKGSTVLSTVRTGSMQPRGPIRLDSSQRAAFIADRRSIEKLTFGAQLTSLSIGDPGATANAAQDGPCSTATFFNIQSIAVSGDGDLFVVDGNSDSFSPVSFLRKVSFGGGCTVTTLFGDGHYVGARLGPSNSARLGRVVGMGFDLSGALLLADSFEKAVLRYRL
jgi:hypothetical protein